MIKSVVKLVVALLAIVLVIVIGPILGIWSLNTLFPVLKIPYAWDTWLAFLLLFGSMTGLRFGGGRGRT
jgi:TctA family transporter